MKLPFPSHYFNQSPLLLLFIIPIISAYFGIRRLQLKSAIHFQQGTRSSCPWRIALSMSMLTLIPFSIWCLIVRGPSALFYLLGNCVAVPITVFSVAPILHYIPSPSVYAYLEHRFQSNLLRQWSAGIQTVFSLLIALFLLLHSTVFIASITSYSFYVICPLLTVFSMLAIVFSGHSFIMSPSLLLYAIGIVSGVGIFVYYGIEDVTSFSSIVPMEYSLSNSLISFLVGLIVSLHLLTSNSSFYQVYFPVSTIYKLRLSLIFFGVFQLLACLFVFIVVSLFTAFLEKNCRMSFSYNSFFLFTKVVVSNVLKSYMVCSALLCVMVFSLQWQMMSLATHIWEEFVKEHFRTTSAGRQLSVMQFIVFFLAALLCSLTLFIHVLVIPYDVISLSSVLIVFTVFAILGGIFLAGYFFPWTNRKGAGFSLGVTMVVCISLFYLYFSHNDMPMMTNSCVKENGNSTVVIIRSFNMEKIVLIASHVPLHAHPILAFVMAVIISLIVSFLTGGQDQMALDWNLVVCTCSSMLSGRSKFSKRNYVDSDAFRYAQQMAGYGDTGEGIYR